MNKLLVFAVYDSKAETYGRPFFMTTKGEALRGFIDISNDPQSHINKHPSDFTLFQIGEYCVQTAKLESLVAPFSLGTAHEFKKTSPTIENHQ